MPRSWREWSIDCLRFQKRRPYQWTNIEHFKYWNSRCWQIIILNQLNQMHVKIHMFLVFERHIGQNLPYLIASGRIRTYECFHNRFQVCPFNRSGTNARQKQTTTFPLSLRIYFKHNSGSGKQTILLSRWFHIQQPHLAEQDQHNPCISSACSTKMQNVNDVEKSGLSRHASGRIRTYECFHNRFQVCPFNRSGTNACQCARKCHTCILLGSWICYSLYLTALATIPFFDLIKPFFLHFIAISNVPCGSNYWKLVISLVASRSECTCLALVLLINNAWCRSHLLGEFLRDQFHEWCCGKSSFVHGLQAFGVRDCMLCWDKEGRKIPEWLQKWVSLALEFVELEQRLLPEQLVLSPPVPGFDPMTAETAASQAKGMLFDHYAILQSRNEKEGKCLISFSRTASKVVVQSKVQADIHCHSSQ